MQSANTNEWQVNTMRLKQTAAAIMAASFISLGGITPALSQTVYAEEHGMGAALPDWIPSDYASALSFRNTYGATLVKDGLVCVVFREQTKKANKGEPDAAPRYEVRTTEGMMSELTHKTYSSDEGAFDYEVVVYYAPEEAGEFEVALVDTWLKSSSLDLGYNHAVAYYSFTVDKEMNITESDMFSWLPDSITEYKEFVDTSGKVAAKDDLVVFCLDSNAGTPYQWAERSQDYTSCFTHQTSVDCSMDTGTLLDGGAIRTIEVYKAVKDGSTVIQWDFSPCYDDYEEPQAERTLIADCTVTNKAQKVSLNGSCLQNLQFRYSSISLYSEDLTASAEAFYSNFSEPATAVITSKKELTYFLSTYLNENALKAFETEYSDSFFKENVLMLSTYLDPYRGRVFKHGLTGAYYKDGKLNIDYASVVSGTRMRTSYFDILQAVVPKKDYDGSEVVWNDKEVLGHDVKRISVIDEDTGKPIEIPYDSISGLFGYPGTVIQGENPYYWTVITAEWLDLDINKEYLPEGCILSETKPREIINNGNNTAEIIFRVKNTAGSNTAVKKYSALTQGLFAEESMIAVLKDCKPEVASSASELNDILSKYITKNYQKDLLNTYDDAFFKDNVLLLDFFIDATGGDKISIEDTVISDKGITVYYNKPAPDFNICNTDYFFILQAAVPKSDYSKQKVSWSCMGDTNGDGEFGVADLVTMQKWLLGSSDTKLSDWKAADIYKDNTIDSFDLVMLRKKLIEINRLEPKKYDINAQYLRRSGDIYGISTAPEATVITSTRQLESYLNKPLDSVIYSTLGGPDQTDKIAKYDDDWFMAHKLIAIPFGEGSGSIGHEVTELTSDYVTIERTVPQMQTCDMASWDIFIELSRDSRISDDFKVIVQNNLVGL